MAMNSDNRVEASSEECLATGLLPGSQQCLWNVTAVRLWGQSFNRGNKKEHKTALKLNLKMDFMSPFKLNVLNFPKGKHNKITTHLLNILPKNNIFQTSGNIPLPAF